MLHIRVASNKVYYSRKNRTFSGSGPEEDYDNKIQNPQDKVKD
ncbi:MAG: hypothetical protein AAF934_02755 [Bacteroidota bacterium]